MEALADPILARFRHRWSGPMARDWSASCCSARARGDARPDSDYDVAVFLTKPDSFWTESGRLAEIGTDILFDTGAVINALPFDGRLVGAGDPLMREIEREGRVV